MDEEWTLLSGEERDVVVLHDGEETVQYFQQEPADDSLSSSSIEELPLPESVQDVMLESTHTIDSSVSSAFKFIPGSKKTQVFDIFEEFAAEEKDERPGGTNTAEPVVENTDLSSNFWGALWYEAMPTKCVRCYKHTPNNMLNTLLTVLLVTALIFVCGVAIGHYIGDGLDQTEEQQIKNTCGCDSNEEYLQQLKNLFHQTSNGLRREHIIEDLILKWHRMYFVAEERDSWREQVQHLILPEFTICKSQPTKPVCQQVLKQLREETEHHVEHILLHRSKYNSYNIVDRNLLDRFLLHELADAIDEKSREEEQARQNEVKTKTLLEMKEAEIAALKDEIRLLKEQKGIINKTITAVKETWKTTLHSSKKGVSIIGDKIQQAIPWVSRTVSESIGPVSQGLHRKVVRGSKYLKEEFGGVYRRVFASEPEVPQTATEEQEMQAPASIMPPVISPSSCQVPDCHDTDIAVKEEDESSDITTAEDTEEIEEDESSDVTTAEDTDEGGNDNIEVSLYRSDQDYHDEDDEDDDDKDDDDNDDDVFDLRTGQYGRQSRQAEQEQPIISDEVADLAYMLASFEDGLTDKQQVSPLTQMKRLMVCQMNWWNAKLAGTLSRDVLDGCKKQLMNWQKSQCKEKHLRKQHKKNKKKERKWRKEEKKVNNRQQAFEEKIEQKNDYEGFESLRKDLKIALEFMDVTEQGKRYRLVDRKSGGSMDVSRPELQELINKLTQEKYQDEADWWFKREQRRQDGRHNMNSDWYFRRHNRAGGASSNEGGIIDDVMLDADEGCEGDLDGWRCNDL